MGQGSGFRVQGAGCRVQGSGFNEEMTLAARAVFRGVGQTDVRTRAPYTPHTGPSTRNPQPKILNPGRHRFRTLGLRVGFRGGGSGEGVGGGGSRGGFPGGDLGRESGGNTFLRRGPSFEELARPTGAQEHHTPQTVDPQFKTLNPQPSTLNPQPSTLNPQPSTLNSPP